MRGAQNESGAAHGERSARCVWEGGGRRLVLAASPGRPGHGGLVLRLLVLRLLLLQPCQPRVDLEQCLSLPGVSIRDVLAPAQEGVLLAHLQVVQVHEPAQ